MFSPHKRYYVLCQNPSFARHSRETGCGRFRRRKWSRSSIVGSIKKGMSRENTSPLPHGDGEGRCLTSSPCAALLWSVALRGIPVPQLLRSSCRAGAPASSVAAMCQPWFYRRLEAYGFVGLSEGAYGGP